MVACPCCGQNVPSGIVLGDGHALVDGNRINLTLTEHEILRLALKDNLSRKQLIDRIYASRSDGGPEWADKSIDTIMHRLNAKLMPAGYAVGSHKIGRSYGAAVGITKLVPA